MGSLAVCPLPAPPIRSWLSSLAQALRHPQLRSLPSILMRPFLVPRFLLQAPLRSQRFPSRWRWQRRSWVQSHPRMSPASPLAVATGPFPLVVPHRLLVNVEFPPLLLPRPPSCRGASLGGVVTASRSAASPAAWSSCAVPHEWISTASLSLSPACGFVTPLLLLAIPPTLPVCSANLRCMVGSQGGGQKLSPVRRRRVSSGGPC